MQQLTDKHFRPSFDGRKNIMMLNVQGVNLVYFYQHPNKHCALFTNIYNKYSNTEKRIKCLCIDVSRYRNVIQLSKDSTSPIESVPHLILFMDGNPVARIKVPEVVQGGDLKLKENVSKVLSKLSAARSQSSQPSQHSQSYRSSSSTSYHEPEGMEREGPSGYPSADDEHTMAMPTDIIPHNSPWEVDLR